ncbi:glycoside hydrolase family 43 protein [Spirosoma pollinicola]|uniref:Beta-xylosidase n=1 Tax=Spirosoma pollinicola TaxID=2057025 RepID=A0A2K8Z0P3_9BACT|nr:glycoside hydrolase family 43 protein [Spirosoma pollinicola]AUD03453.1 beta-xylosidase [Spirosoma pollinicola]
MKALLICLILSLTALQVSAQAKQEIFFADVTIYVQGGKYYLTGSKGGNSGPQGFALLESKDLKTWAVSAKANDSLGMILTKGDHTFGTKGFWAPQILKDDGTYYLTYTADEQTALAQSTSLLGPYRQKEVRPIDGSEKNIDSYLFRDTDCKYYFYSVRFNKGNYLYVAEFDLKTGTINAKTLKRCFEQTQAWEATPNYQSAPIMEGPTVIKLRNKYYLFYSANHFQNIDYAIGYAVADSPYGPWVKYNDNPIIHRSIVGENGSGHGDLFEGLDKQLYYVYHIHNSSDKVGPRRTRIVPVVKQWDEKAGVYRFSVKGDEVIVPVMVEK